MRDSITQWKKMSKLNMKCIFLVLVILFAAGCGGNGAITGTGTGSGANTPIDHLSLGERFLLELEYEQALFHFLALIEFEPMNPRGYTGAAQAHIGLGQHYEAIAILQRGLEVLPDNEDILNMLEWLHGDTEMGSSSPIWYTFTNEQRALLEGLRLAAKNREVEAFYELAKSPVLIDVLTQTRRAYDSVHRFNTYSTYIEVSYPSGEIWDLRIWHRERFHYCLIFRTANTEGFIHTEILNTPHYETFDGVLVSREYVFWVTLAYFPEYFGLEFCSRYGRGYFIPYSPGS